MTADLPTVTEVTPFVCTHCPQWIGEILTPSVLRIGGIVYPVRRAMQLRCPRCGNLVIWHAQEKKP